MVVLLISTDKAQRPSKHGRVHYSDWVRNILWKSKIMALLTHIFGPVGLRSAGHAKVLAQQPRCDPEAMHVVFEVHCLYR